MQVSAAKRTVRRWLSPYLLLIFVPISIGLSLAHFSHVLVSIVTVLALLPLTSFIARATEDLATRRGPILGSLMNATLGNAIELMIAIFALRSGLVELVRASIIGSIVLNILLLIGLSMIFGGIKHHEQRFNRDAAGVASSMLLIAVAGLALPTIYWALTDKSPVIMSKAVSITLATTYLFSLFFVLITHRHLFEARRDYIEEVTWKPGKALLVLLLSIGAAAVESEILVGTLRPLVEITGLHESFIGLVIIAILTNIPEHIAATRYGMRDNITLSLEIGMNSAIQIALFVAPILVFVSPLLGVELTLAFAPFQMIALILAVMIINYIGSDGVCNWLEGVQLAAVYIIIAIAFYFV